jgi:hypothetical protein
MLPFEILPFVLAASFFFTWGYVVWLEYREQVDASRRDGEAPGGIAYFGGGSIGRTCDSPRAIRSKAGAPRPTIRVAARSTPATL